MLIARAAVAVVIIAGIWFIGFPGLLVASRIEPFPLEFGALRILGILPLALGAAGFGWVTWTFATVGHGTPLVFDSPPRFVATGPHRWVRNPMYIADVLIILGEAILLESSAILLYGVTFWLGVHLVVVFLEEPRLRRRFRPTYETYCAQVPRWIPRSGRVELIQQQ